MRSLQGPLPACVTSRPLSLPLFSLGPKTEVRQAGQAGRDGKQSPSPGTTQCVPETPSSLVLCSETPGTPREGPCHTRSRRPPRPALASHWGTASPQGVSGLARSPLSYASGSCRTMPATPATRCSPGLRSGLSASQTTGRGPVVVLLSPWRKRGERYPNPVGCLCMSAEGPRPPASSSAPFPGVSALAQVPDLSRQIHI